VEGEQLPIFAIIPTSWPTPANCTGKTKRRLSAAAVSLRPENHPATLNSNGQQTAATKPEFKKNNSNTGKSRKPPAQPMPETAQTSAEPKT